VKVWVEMSFSAGMEGRSRRSSIEMQRGRSTRVLYESLDESLGIEMNIGGRKFRDEGSEVEIRPRRLRRNSTPELGSTSTVIFSIS